MYSVMKTSSTLLGDIPVGDWIDRLSPLSLRPYLRLMRLDRPVGTLLLLWPTLWALWLAAGGRPKTHILAVFVAGVVLMRSAGCVINDYADRGFDPYVARTRGRPLASGRVSPLEALLLFAVLSVGALLLALMMARHFGRFHGGNTPVDE